MPRPPVEPWLAAAYPDGPHPGRYLTQIQQIFSEVGELAKFGQFALIDQLAQFTN